MIKILENYLRKNLGNKLLVTNNKQLQNLPSLVVELTKLEEAGDISEQEYILQSKITFITDDGDQQNFIKDCDQISKLIKSIAKHEPQVLGVLNVSTSFNNNKNTIQNNYDIKLVMRV